MTNVAVQTEQQTAPASPPAVRQRKRSPQSRRSRSWRCSCAGGATATARHESSWSRGSPRFRGRWRGAIATPQSRMEDLYQVAQLGLVKAIDGYDPDRGFRFTAYAVPTILGELRRYFRSATWAVHVPRAAQERALEVRDAERTLTDERGHSPTVSELAQFMELSIEEVLDGMQAMRALGSVSLDAPRGSDGAEEGGSIADMIGGEDPGLRARRTGCRRERSAAAAGAASAGDPADCASSRS